LCSLASFRGWTSCCHVQRAHLRHANRLAHALHGKTQMRELNRYTEQVPHSRTPSPSQKLTLNTWIFLASTPPTLSRCVTPADRAVGVLHGDSSGRGQSQSGYRVTALVAVILFT
jgi:hypothetical protein